MAPAAKTEPWMQHFEVGGFGSARNEAAGLGYQMNFHDTGGPCKLFVGGISSQTSTEALHQHFAKYGRVVDAVVMSKNGRARGFGFVTFESTASAVAVLSEAQWLDGRLVDVKRAVPGERTQERSSSNKIFVGGLPQDTTTDDLRDHFGMYGSVADCVVMVDRRTNRSRGFGFVRFSNGPQGCAAAQAVLLNFPNHRLRGKWVEVKPATPAAVLQELASSPSCPEGGGSSPGSSSPMGCFLDPQQMSMFMDPTVAYGWDLSGFGMAGSTMSPMASNAAIKGPQCHARGRRGRRRNKKQSGQDQSGDEEDTTVPTDDDLTNCLAGLSASFSEGSYALRSHGLGGAGTLPFVPSSALSSSLLEVDATKALKSSIFAPDHGKSRQFAGGRKNAAGGSSENDPSRANAMDLLAPMKVTCRDLATVTQADHFDGFTRDDFLALEVHRPSVGSIVS
eukprot:TRINITY_DN16020_c0_g1_i1.p1 TRINITY_DN16020_c0_g1~~TRINITY_DN16020_c0_g1_i1.p1  ORF type:complete len:472 (+),score=77.76 TRINITY_DN16020_c0_g1_i1:68-1417(+)